MQINKNSLVDKKTNIINVYDFLRAFESELVSYGFTPPEISLETNKYHRFKSHGCKHKCCEYRIFDYYKGAQFRCFRRGIFYTWFYGIKSKYDTNFNNQELNKFKQQREVQSQEAQARCREILSACKPADKNHPYVKAKGIIPYGAFQKDSHLYIPIFGNDYSLLSLQSIDELSNKRFAKGSTTKGGCNVLGDAREHHVIFVVEGWATGCTVLEATGVCTVCVFSAGNFKPVVGDLIKTYPMHQIIIVADNDYKRGPDNTGLKIAIETSRIYHTKTIHPNFRAIGIDGSDFNDVHRSLGIDYVRNYIFNELNKLTSKD